MPRVHIGRKTANATRMYNKSQQEKLAVYLENGQRVYFKANYLHQVIENPRKTTLTAFF